MRGLQRFKQDSITIGICPDQLNRSRIRCQNPIGGVLLIHGLFIHLTSAETETRFEATRSFG